MNRQTRCPLTLGVLIGTVALSGCGSDPVLSDRLVQDKGAEAFLDRIAQNCGTLSVGNQQLKYLLDENSDDTYFIDESSKLYFGGVEKDAYSTDINALYPSGTNQPALGCIFTQLDQ